MGRDKKTSLVWFNVDVDRYSDIKIEKLCYKFKANGISIYDFFLAKIYGGKGYYLELEEAYIFSCARYFTIEEEFVLEVLSYCSEVGLFDKLLHEKAGILTSESIQRRYLAASKTMKRISTELIPTISLLGNSDKKAWLAVDNSLFQNVPEVTTLSPEEKEFLPEEKEFLPEKPLKTPVPVPHSIVEYSIVEDQKNKQKKQTVLANARRVVDRLNFLTGKKFHPENETTISDLEKIFQKKVPGKKSFFTAEDAIAVVEYRNRIAKSKKDRLWLKPSTLFRWRNFSKSFDDMGAESEEDKVFGPKPTPFHKKAMAAYASWYIKNFDGMAPKITNADRKNLNGIIEQLLANEKTSHDVLGSWNLILGSWSKLDNFTQKRTSLTQIFTDWNSIISQLSKAAKTGVKNQATRKASDHPDSAEMDAHLAEQYAKMEKINTQNGQGKDTG